MKVCNDTEGGFKYIIMKQTNRSIIKKLFKKILTFTESQYSKINHTHDDRYYTESEIDTKLNGKANSSHTHSYAASSHTHDDRYYTETEVNSKITAATSTLNRRSDIFILRIPFEFINSYTFKAGSSYTKSLSYTQILNIANKIDDLYDIGRIVILNAMICWMQTDNGDAIKINNAYIIPTNSPFDVTLSDGSIARIYSYSKTSYIATVFITFVPSTTCNKVSGEIMIIYI